MVTTKRIGVLMGGSSAEREVSLRSGNAVFQALRELGYDVVALDAGTDVCEMLKKEKVKIVFLTLHGGVGEDGSIQGLLEVLGIPYTGCGVLASALAMDKEASKKMFLFHRIPVPLFSVIAASDAEREFPVRADFPMPWIIKPATEGSSIGVEIVRERSSLGEALKRAGRFGKRIIVEQFITGKEIQVGIIDNRVLGSVEVRPHREFYSYEAKYTPGLTDYILPPEIQPEVLRKTEETALAANRALGCSGATRVDLILGNRGDLYVLEVNTIPGMTETSLLPKIAGLSGLSFPLLVEEILRGAVARERNT